MRTTAGVALAFALAVAGCGGRQEDEMQSALSANGADRACRCHDVHTQLAMPDGCVALLLADGSFAALPACPSRDGSPGPAAPANDTRSTP
jgi:hypothetical protein